MSAGGDGVNGIPTIAGEVFQVSSNKDFIVRRLQANHSLTITENPRVHGVKDITCVLCGRPINDEPSNQEHPLPQWLHSFAGDVTDKKAEGFRGFNNPTWRQLSLLSHKKCNSVFAKQIEEPVVKSIKSITNGGEVTWSQLDLIFDWLDKVKSTAAHMGTALSGHRIVSKYGEINFPNRRIGALDRLVIAYRIDTNDPPLDLWDCLGEAFLTTPAVVSLRINDLIMIYVSDIFLLSSAFGLGSARIISDEIVYIAGSKTLSLGLGVRNCRIPGAKIFAQPMRRQIKNSGFDEKSFLLQDNGDGYIFELIGEEWKRVKRASFGNLPKIDARLGTLLADVENVEWLIYCKEQSLMRTGNDDGLFLESLPLLRSNLDSLLDELTMYRVMDFLGDS